MAQVDLEYGFVPKHILEDLQDIGNWKLRANGIDKLQKALRDVKDKSTVVSGLPKFVAFLMTLVADPNFKMALSSLQILGDLVSKMGRDVEPHVRNIVPGLVDKFGDSKAMVRTANLKVLKQLINLFGPQKVVEAMSLGMQHSNGVVREEVVNSCIMIMMQHRHQNLNHGQLFQILCTAMIDNKERVRAAAMEAMAALCSCVGAQAFQQMLQACSLKEQVKQQVRQRLKSPALPVVSAEGVVEAAQQVPGSMQEAADSHGSAGLGAMPSRRLQAGKLPWEVPSPPSHPTDNNGSTFSMPSPIRTKVAVVEDGADHNARAKMLNPSRLSGGPSSDKLHKQPLGSNFSHELTLAPAGNRHMGERGGGRSLQPLDHEALPMGRVAAARPAAPSEKQQQQHSAHISSSDPSNSFVTLSPSNSGYSYGSSRPVVPAHKMGESPSSFRSSIATEDSAASPLTPSYKYQPLFVGKRNTALPSSHSAEVTYESYEPKLSSPSQLQHGLLSSPPLYSKNSSVLSSPQSGYASGAASNDLYKMPSRNVGGMQQPGSPTPWLQTAFESQQGVGSPMSPSKGLLLANLKRRQEEKRAISAQLPERPFGLSSDYGPSTSSASLLEPVPAKLRASAETSNSMSFDTYNRITGGAAALARPDQPQRPRGPAKGATSNGTQGDAGAQRQNSGGLPSFCDYRPPGQAAEAAHPSSNGPLSSRLGRAGSIPQTGSGAPKSARRSSCADEDQHQAMSRKPSSFSGHMNSFDSLPDSQSVSSPMRHAGVPLRMRPSDTDMSLPPDSPSYANKSANKLDEVSNADLTPLPDPERSLRSAIVTLQAANNAGRKEIDWQGQYEALNDCRRLVKHHPETVRSSLHEFVCASIPAIDALRSFTVKNALILYQEMFCQLGKALDRELDEIVPILLKRAGEVSNAGRENFLTSEADRTLSEMSRNVTEARAISALVACANHKSPTVRSRVASQLDCIMENGIGTGLMGNWACLEKLFKCVAGFLNEGALDTRTYGKRIIWNIKQSLGGRGDFDRLVSQVQPTLLQKKVQEVLEGMNGPPPPPSRSMGSRLMSRGVVSSGSGASPLRGGSISAPVGAHSIGGQGPPPSSRFSDRADMCNVAGSASRLGQPTPERRRLPQGGGGSGNASSQARAEEGLPPRSSSFPKRVVADTSTGFGTQAQDTLSKAIQGLTAKDFRERIEGLKLVDSIAGALAAAPDGLLMQLLDNLTIRLGDGNSKVNIQALESLGHLFECLKERVAVGLNTLVPALAANLGSANEKIRAVAIQAADKLVASVDPALLVQNFSHCVSNGNLRGKVLLVEKLADVINALYPMRPQLVVKYAVPASFCLANDTKGGAEVKAAANLLLSALARNMGQQLLEHTTSLTPVLQQRVADAVASAQYY